jgi:hypothetical protein
MAAKKQPMKPGPTARAVALSSAAPRPTSEGVAASAAVVLGRLMAGSTPLAPLVEFAGNGAGPVRARATVALDGATIERAVVTGQSATLVFENGDPRLPIVTGLVRTDQTTTPFQDLLVSPRPSDPAAPPARRPPLEARLDGDRIVLEGKNEIVLKCGEASITLRRDGKMVLRGAYVETYAKGVNRIKGGSVKIN